MWYGASSWVAEQGKKAVMTALGIHILSWVMQFLGHGVFEGRKPALIDNLLQSVVMAPLFVWLHVLFFFGYSKPLQDDIHSLVAKKLQELKSQTSKSA